MDRTSGRLRILALLVILMFIGLTTRLWFLQVLAADKYKDKQVTNRTRTVLTPALRGNILDSHGKPLVKNRLSLQVQVNQQDLGANSAAVLTRLSKLLMIKLSTLESRLKDPRYYAYAPIPVAFDVPKQVSWYVTEHAQQFPGVRVVEAPVRDYPDGDLAAHILGNVGPITADETKEPLFASYGQNDVVGQTGLERQYERYLQGTKGKSFYLVNAAGKQIRTIGSEAPQPGDNVVLSIDARIQRIAEQQLLSGIMRARGQADSTTGQSLVANAGAAVVMDPKTGAVIALASWPTFDPQWFVQGMTTAQYKARFNSSDGQPALNRAEFQVYAPGSSFKPFVALSALRSGVANEQSSYPCPSVYYYRLDPNHAFNNFESSSGYMDLASALRVSCDTVFYKLGADFYDKSAGSAKGTDLLTNDLLPFGFGSQTGIDLPVEAGGTLPGFDYALQHKSVYPFGWLPGNSILTAIGQDSVTVTPLQLATAYSSIANGGKLCRPHLADHVETPDGKTVKTIEPKCHPIPYTPQQLRFIRSALSGVPVSGTARTAFLQFPLSSIPVAGKTGTAQRQGFQDTAWFAGMAPAGNPKYVVVAMVEQGGFGGVTAAPIVRHIMEGLFHLPQTNPIKATAP
ncbi:MAG: penicillin-binding protein 2 [Actinomycetota bacterium]